MITARGVKGLKIAVLGLGRTGLSAFNSLRAGGAKVIGWDDDEKVRSTAKSKGVELADLKHEINWNEIANLVVSPGIPHLYPEPHPILSKALEFGVPIDNDIGIFFKSYLTNKTLKSKAKPLVIAVTGTNGKSTTSALIAHILKENKLPCQLAGNIGYGALEIEPYEDRGVVVLELSSFQIELASCLAPDIAVLINLTSDHLDRHNGLGGYFAAKRRLFFEGTPKKAIVGIDEKEGLFLASQFALDKGNDSVIRFSCTQEIVLGEMHVNAKNGFLSEFRNGHNERRLDLNSLDGLLGVHNHQNICAAYSVCRALGLEARLIEQAILSFKGLEHRTQLIRCKNGVRFINDSKATNVTSAAKALNAFQKVRWICGGVQKPGGLFALENCLNSVVKAYVIGQNAFEFAEQLKCKKSVCVTMEKALAEAFRDAKNGDVILLSPAAASFDQYKNFEERGKDFVERVQNL